MIQSFSDNVAALVGYALIGSTFITGLAYWLFKTFGEKWLSSKFEERLASYKHEQQKEIEQLRFNISRMMDRTAKLHQREFESLPEIWGRLVDVHSGIASLTSPLQMYPDVDRMTSKQFDEFVAATPFSDVTKDELRTAPKKLEFYKNAITWHRISEAYKRHFEFSMYFQKNSIFVHEELDSKIQVISDALYSALVEKESSHEHKEFRQDWRKSKEEMKKATDDLKSLKREVQSRLWTQPNGA
jgi:predicted translin family RNA/ssDNA-binding protein